MVTSGDNPIFIDTNVLVYTNIPAYPLHQLALQTIQGLIDAELESFDSQQNSVEDRWNEILADPPSKTENYLHWIYESHFGKRAPQNLSLIASLMVFFLNTKNQIRACRMRKIFVQKYMTYMKTF